MGQLSKLPNIGQTIESKLERVGIDTIDEFKALGSKAAWLKIKEIDRSACLVHLYALEGAIKGKNISELDAATKTDLKAFSDEYQLQHTDSEL